MRGAVHGDPVAGRALEARHALAHLVVENLGAAAGDGVEAGVAEARDGRAQVEIRVLGDGEHFGGRQTVQPDLREALFDAAEEALEPVDLEIGVDAALHQHAGATHLDGLGDLLVNRLEVEDVALFGARVGLAGPRQRAVEGAEGAVLGAEVGVVDVAIDDVGDHALGMQAAAHGVGLKAQADEVGGMEVVERLLAGQRHTAILARQRGTGIRDQGLAGRPKHCVAGGVGKYMPGIHAPFLLRKRNSPR